ncbi:MAG: RdgB/HAM1 family non-canonical purine NTP pyrophosphatase [Bacilli bacterium]|nr:RdgB/HAM1 family non-canonical purine NTP pyrophosphatase [Bacilli bacterium]
MKFELIAATNNKHKLIEIKAILEAHDIKVYSLNDVNIDIEVDENGSTYRENALKKAIEVAKLTKLPVMSDDSGIEIEALDNGPGIHTARYAESVGGYQEAFKIIEAKCKEKNNYKALFNCDIALANLEDEPLVFEGRVPGSIAKDISGTNGFGFDPVFVSDEVGKANALLTFEEKNIYSARSKALAKLIDYLIKKGLAK